MPDTPLGITYPGSTGHTRLWEHFQTLAEDVDALLARKGWIAEGIRNTTSPTFTTVETVVQSLTFDAIAGVKYKITALQSFQSTVAGEAAQVRLRWAVGTAVTAGGTQLDSKLPAAFTVNLGALCSLVGTFVSPITDKITVGVTGIRSVGTTGTWSSFGDAKQLNTILVEGV
ncbi:hypothetical protein AB0N38_10480 [Micromonospora aurantiaca]|uniref:hypothetical protein n=1 Tax=Micromonospora aurantiaca (nom. illeg.) TaxID=47850 RepID=UPI003444307D